MERKRGLREESVQKILIENSKGTQTSSDSVTIQGIVGRPHKLPETKRCPGKSDFINRLILVVSSRHSYPQSSILLFFHYMDVSYQVVFIDHMSDRTLRPLLCEYYIAHTSSHISSALGPNIFLFCYLFPYVDATHCTTF